MTLCKSTLRLISSFPMLWYCQITSNSQGHLPGTSTLLSSLALRTFSLCLINSFQFYFKCHTFHKTL
jgi:hypothetical protein